LKKVAAKITNNEFLAIIYFDYLNLPKKLQYHRELSACQNCLYIIMWVLKVVSPQCYQI